jgi:hypothetical protein
MLCKEVKDEIMESALFGAAPGDSAREHMAACPACQKEFASLRSTMDVLDTWTTPEPSPYFDVRLRARLREVKEQEAAAAGSIWSRFASKIGMAHLSWKPAAAIVFAALLAVGGGMYRFGIGIDRTSGPVAVNQPCPVIDLQALDQNQQVLNELQELDDNDGPGSQTTVSE